MPKMTVPERVAALEKAVRALLQSLAIQGEEIRALKQREENPSAKPHRQRGSKAKLTQEEWLAQRREIAANARKSRWLKKKTVGRRAAKASSTTKDSR